MEDYPRDLVDFDERFATKEACRDYLIMLRWPDGFRCRDVWASSLGPFRGKLFYRLLEQAVETRPVPYAALTRNVHAGRALRRHRGRNVT